MARFFVVPVEKLQNSWAMAANLGVLFFLDEHEQVSGLIIYKTTDCADLS